MCRVGGVEASDESLITKAMEAMAIGRAETRLIRGVILCIFFVRIFHGSSLAVANLNQSLPTVKSLNTSLYVVNAGFQDYISGLYNQTMSPSEAPDIMSLVVDAIIEIVQQATMVAMVCEECQPNKQVSNFSACKQCQRTPWPTHTCEILLRRLISGVYGGVENAI